MNYSVEKLLTVSECDQLLGAAGERKRRLLNDQSNLTYQRDNSTRSSDDVNADIVATQAELSGITTFIDTLTGDKKAEYLRRKVKLENRLDDLGFRKEDVGSIRLLNKQLELALIEAELTEIEVFITAITTRKGQI